MLVGLLSFIFFLKMIHFAAIVTMNAVYSELVIVAAQNLFTCVKYLTKECRLNNNVKYWQVSKPRKTIPSLNKRKSPKDLSVSSIKNWKTISKITSTMKKYRRRRMAHWNTRSRAHGFFWKLLNKTQRANSVISRRRIPDANITSYCCRPKKFYNVLLHGFTNLSHKGLR